ncbi:MAG: TonB-dependent receptor [Saprospiraceae bacterium]|nr:TonB-dependent receptor [Saprospiraceae bacterium]
MNFLINKRIEIWRRAGFSGVIQKLSFMLVLVFLSMSSIIAQKTITGTVTDASDGEPLIGANIVERGTDNGTITDIDGNFSITVSNDCQFLDVSYIGYTDKSVPAGGDITSVDVALESGQILDEVIVIGYSPVSRKKILGAVASLDEKDIIQNVPVGAFDAVQGRLSGVQILSNGGPGAGFDVRIRGISTFSSGTSPLFVVDGQQLENIDNIDPNDILSLEVLKDGATAAIYGSRGANGVVLITTKAGSSEKIKLDITANTSFTTLNGGIPLANTAERIFYEDIRRNNSGPLTGIQRDSLSLLNRNSNDLQDLLTRTARRDVLNVALSGGSDKVKVYWNTGFQNQEGVVVNSSYRRVNSRFKLQFDPSSKFKIGTNLNGSFEQGFGLNEGQVFQQMVERIAYFPVYEPNGTFTPEIAGRQNPVAEANLRTLSDRNYRAQLFNFAEYRILPSLSFKSTLGVNFRYRKRNDFEPILTQNPRSPIPRGAERRNLTYDIQQENFLNYIENFDQHSVSAFAGMQTQRYYLEGFNISSQFVSDAIETFNNIDPLTLSITNGTINERHNLYSLFAGFNYDYDNKYLIGATIRRDGSSRFGAENKYGTFPSFTLGWRASNENFIQNRFDFIDNLLIRFSYGETGNERIGNYEFTSTYLPGFVYNGVSGVAPSRLGNPGIGWEATTSTNLGFDLGLLNNKLNVTFEVWKKETTDLLASIPLPEESGFNSIRSNVGAVTNNGIDIGINGTIYSTRDFSWESGFNISFLENEVTALAGGTPFQSGDYLIEVGQPLGNIFGYKNLGVYQYNESNAYTPDGVRLDPVFNDQGEFMNYTLNGSAYSGEIKQLRNAGRTLEGGDIIWDDVNNDFDINIADKQVIGNGLPEFFGGITNNLSYKNLSLSFLFDFTFGNDIWRRYDELRNDLNSSNETPGPDRINNAWMNPGDVTEYPRLNRVPQNRERPNSFYVTDGDFIKLRFVRFNFDLPKSLLSGIGGIQSATFNLSFNDFFTWTNYVGYNPELGSRGSALQPGRDNLRYPNSRSVIAGLRVQF